jgi:hypoxanthine phosphoribosyltransferase
LDLNTSIAGRHVLIVGDIIDSGRTLASVIDLLKTATGVAVCMYLLDKVSRREVEVPVRYRGFAIEDKFVLVTDSIWMNFIETCLSSG